MCVCVKESEKEREREKEGEGDGARDGSVEAWTPRGRGASPLWCRLSAAGAPGPRSGHGAAASA